MRILNDFYVSGAFSLEYTLCLPDEVRETYPLLCEIHGSGWHRGRRSNHLPYAEALTRAGFAVVLPFYRTKTSHGVTPYECVDDGAAIWKLINEKPEQFFAGEKFLGGASSGGQIAFMAAIRTGYLPNRFVFFSPAFDDVILPRSLGGKDCRDISPLENLREGLPPMLILQAADDKTIPIESSRAFVEKAKTFGVDARLNEYPSGGHTFPIPNGSVERGVNYLRVMADAAAFMAEGLTDLS